MRSRAAAGNGFGVNEPRMLWTTISVPRDFIPAVQLATKPRDIPTSATTAAMPTEIPTNVRPVRTGRRISPRATTARNVMSRDRGDLRGIAVKDDQTISHLDRAGSASRDAHIVGD